MCVMLIQIDPPGTAPRLAVVCAAIEWLPQLWAKHCCLQHDLRRLPSQLLCCQRHEEDCDHQLLSALPEKPCDPL